MGNAAVNQFGVAGNGLGINPMAGLAQGNTMNMNQMLQNSGMSLGSGATGNGTGVGQFQNQKYDNPNPCLWDLELHRLKLDALLTCKKLAARRNQNRQDVN